MPLSYFSGLDRGSGGLGPSSPRVARGVQPPGEKRRLLFYFLPCPFLTLQVLSVAFFFVRPTPLSKATTGANPTPPSVSVGRF